MKTLTPSFLFLLVALLGLQGAYAQPVPDRITLWPSSIANTQQGCALVTLAKPGGGYATGTSGDLGGGFYNLEVAQLYDAGFMWLADSITEAMSAHSCGPKIDTVRVRITRKTVSATPGNVVVKIYDAVDGTDLLGNNRPEPTTVLGTSAPISMADIDVSSGVFTPFTFSTPVDLPADKKFFLSVVLSQVDGDTICVGGASCTEFTGYSYQQLHSSIGPVWIQFDKNLQVGNPPVFLETDLAIVPDLFFNCPAAVSNLSGFQSVEVYPNPVSSELNIDFKLQNTSDVSVSLINVNGQKTYIESYDQLNGGSHHKSINVSTLPSGFYMYEISSSTGNTYGKFIVK